MTAQHLFGLIAAVGLAGCIVLAISTMSKINRLDEDEEEQ